MLNEIEIGLLKIFKFYYLVGINKNLFYLT